jgi:tRNA-specific 2-thiouridylase
MGKRVVLAMSGGVDSSVAAILLREQGYDVVGLFMRTGAHVEEGERRAKTCCSATDALDARAVADRLDIPFYVLDFEAEFGRIVDYFVDEYAAGRTPNPCVMCNVWLKFGRLWSYGKQAGADFVATGHHARVVTDAEGGRRIARGVDGGKDQSYVLFGLRRELLQRVLLPIGEMPKEEVRRIAREWDLPIHDKVDSQEICFIPDNDYVRFIRQHRPELHAPGTVVDEEGREVGQHQGIEGFTIGQRRGLGIAFGEPRYVVQIEPATRRVQVGPRGMLERRGLVAGRFNWQVVPPDGPVDCFAQIRSQHKAVEAVAERLDESRVEVRFARAQSAVTPGQVVTLYDGEMVLGGGWIEGSIGTS